MTRDSRGSLISLIARPSTASFTESSIDIVSLCHARALASTRLARHALHVLARVGVRSLPFSAFVAGTFLFGWLLGLAIVFKLWHLSHAPRWIILSGVGYVTLMLPPTITGFTLAWGTSRLAARGWGPMSLGLVVTGVAGLVAGLLVL
jgi:hypothetical protein